MGGWEITPSELSSSTFETWVAEPIAKLQLPTSETQDAAAELRTAEMREFVRSADRAVGWLLHLADAAASSTIEEIYPSPTAVVRANLRGQGTPPALEAIANMAAVRRALEIGALAGPLTVADLCEIHAALTERLPNYAFEPGAIRDRQVFVGEFTPPGHRRVPDLLDDLAAFCARTDVNPIQLAAIAHARFEEIHPFPDGNGRTGRALVHALWGKRGLASTHSTLPFSTVLAKNRSQYLRSLNTFHSIAPLEASPDAVAPVLEVFLGAVRASLARGEELRASVTALVAKWQAAVMPRRRSLASALLEYVPSCPTLDVAHVVDHFGVAPRTARAALRRLVDAGVLSTTRAANRGLYEATELIGIFTDTFKDDVPFDLRTEAELVLVNDQPRTTDPTLDQTRKWARCGHDMPRAKKRCALAAGHSGPHRSTVPWLK